MRCALNPDQVEPGFIPDDHNLPNHIHTAFLRHGGMIFPAILRDAIIHAHHFLSDVEAHGLLRLRGGAGFAGCDKRGPEHAIEHILDLGFLVSSTAFCRVVNIVLESC